MIICDTRGDNKMSTAKVAITLDENLLKRLDRLARECAKLDRKFEQSMAEEGLSVEVGEWPEY
jgi:predicted transcriptional regulator